MVNELRAGVKSELIILAGGPASGKSTTISEIRSRGLNVVDEAAREVLNEKKYSDYAELQREIFKRQIERENNSLGRVYFDRSALEGVAYSFLRLGIIPEPLASYDFRNRYSVVFILDRLPFVQDGVRIEKDESEAERIHRAIYGVYCGYGYNPINVPLFAGSLSESVSKRVDFILSKLEMMKGGVE